MALHKMTLRKERYGGMFEDLIRERYIHDHFGRITDRGGEFFDPSTGRMVKWKRHVM